MVRMARNARRSDPIIPIIGLGTGGGAVKAGKQNMDQ